MAKSLKPPGKAKAKPAGKTKKEAAAKPAAAKKGAAANGGTSKKAAGEKPLPDEPTQDALASARRAMKSQLAECYRFKKDMEEAQAIVRTKSGTYRSAIKTAIKIGTPFGYTSKVILKSLEDRDRDVEEIDRENKQINELWALQDIPVGTQLGLFDDGRTVATTIEDRQAAGTNGDAKVQPNGKSGNGKHDDAGFDTPEALEAAGYKSFGAKMDEADCPYPEGHAHRDSWLKGHRKAAEHQGALTSKRLPAATHAEGNA